MDVRETYRDEMHVSAVFRNVIISHSLGEPTTGYIEDWVKTIGLLAREYPRSVASIIIIDGSAKPPGEEIRNVIKASISKAAPNIRALAQVVEGSGFTSAAKRSALSFITLVARFPCPVKIFGTRREAAYWIRERLSEQPVVKANDMTLEELTRACDTVVSSTRLLSASGKP
jgi:hypothetical protein